MRIAVIPGCRAIRCRGRRRLGRLTLGHHLLIHFIAGDLREREARLVRRPQVERERQLHDAVEIRRDRQLGQRQVRIGLIDEGRYRDARGACLVPVGVAGRQRRLAQIQHLAVVAEMRGPEWHAVEPLLAGGPGARAVIDVGPARDRSRARHVTVLVVHERDQVGRRALGAAQRAGRGHIAVREIRGKVPVRVRSARAHQEGIGRQRPGRRIGGAERDGDGKYRECGEGGPWGTCSGHVRLLVARTHVRSRAGTGTARRAAASSAPVKSRTRGCRRSWRRRSR